MAQDSIDKVLQSRKPAETPASESDNDKFFSIMVGETMQEHFLELRFNIGLKSCFSYTDLQWFNYDPEEGSIILEFGGFLVSLKGRGLGDRLFNGLRQKRVAWVKEADTEMQDHKGNETFIQEITITPPREEGEEKPAA
jgi:hypothetical protein